MPDPLQMALRAARSDPHLRHHRHALRLLATTPGPAASPSLRALVAALAARLRGRWDLVVRQCSPVTTRSNRIADQQLAWTLIAHAAQARHRWSVASAARQQVRALTAPADTVRILTDLADLEQAVERNDSTGAVRARRHLLASAGRHPPCGDLQQRVDLVWMASRCCGGGRLTRGDLPRLKRVVHRLSRTGSRQTAETSDQRRTLMRTLVRSSGRKPVVVALGGLLGAEPVSVPLLIIALEADLLSGALAAYRGRRGMAARHHAAVTTGLRQLPEAHPARQRLQAVSICVSACGALDDDQALLR